MSQRPIRFFHAGHITEVDGLAPTTSVLTWLREHARRTGTKEGCNEGDCGACTVLIGELDAQGRLDLRPVNACIALLPTLDGKALLTVEDLQGRHPAQQALALGHGTQCGFCTPGFVMTLAALHQRHSVGGTTPSRPELADELSGNLCRCTGYRPILEAGVAMFQHKRPAIDETPIVAALRQLRGDPPLEQPGFAAPHTVEQLAAARLTDPEARLLSGGTDVALWVNKQFRELPRLLYLGRVEALRGLREVGPTDPATDDGAHLEIGAAVTLHEAWAALAERWPMLREMGLRFASPPVRHAGTLVGNLANGSPIGDAAPVLLALDAQLVLRRGEALRLLPLDAFYVDYMKTRLEPGEWVQAVRIPLAGQASAGSSDATPMRTVLRAYKHSKRFDSDISAVAAGLWLQLEGDRVRAARLAFGGMAATVRRAKAAEAAMLGQPWTEATILAAMAALDAEFTPMTDLRASAAHRRRIAGQLLKRFWLETRADDPLPPSAVSVWAAADAHALQVQP